MNPALSEVTERLAVEFENDAEWKAYQARVARILLKRNGGKGLSKEENAILADYKIAASLSEIPKHFVTREPLPPILYGYTEAQDAFRVAKDQLYGLRARGSAAFTGNIILTATLAQDIAREPNPEPVPLNTIHTGAKGKLTPDLQESIIKALRFCPILEVVARAHGVTGKTLANWREKGEAGQKRYREFFQLSDAALGEAQMGLLRDIATEPDWKAKAKVLEFTDQSRFGRQSRLEHTGKGGGPIKTDGPPPLMITLQGVAEHSYDPNTAPDPDEEEDEDREGGE